MIYLLKGSIFVKCSPSGKFDEICNECVFTTATTVPGTRILFKISHLDVLSGWTHPQQIVVYTKRYIAFGDMLRPTTIPSLPHSR